MKEGTNLSIIIPVYNEYQNLQAMMPDLVRFCNENYYNLIIVNDGSLDRTGEVLKQYEDIQGVKIIHHKLNKGYGAAMKTGIRNADTDIVITMDADGQHQLPDVKSLFDVLKENNADMVIGSRKHLKSYNLYRAMGKWNIRKFIRLFFRLNIYDINSGMKIYRTDLAKKYVEICPDSMAFSDVITLIFISQKHLVLEHPISVLKRLSGESKISTHTAFETIIEILKSVLFLKPMRFFLPVSLILIFLGLIWGIPIILKGRGISVGANMSILAGVIFFVIGLVLEQLWLIIKNRL